jgi:hypothetical protein
MGAKSLLVETDDPRATAVEQLLAGGELLPAQTPTRSTWSPEKKLAGAVLSAALLEVRERHADPRYAQRVREDVAWIFSDDRAWPYAFLPLCAQFDLEPGWVRRMVVGWLRTHGRDRAPRQLAPHRLAA